MSAKDNLTKQILGQGLTSKWTGSGYGSAEANAADMARLLADIGITDIKQFGKIPKYEPAFKVGETYNGEKVVEGRIGFGQPTGKKYIVRDTGRVGDEMEAILEHIEIPADAKLEPIYGMDHGPNRESFSTVDPSRIKTVDGKLFADTGEKVFGNKVTGQEVPSTYGDRQNGNFFGGTYEGKGNTGYGVKFDNQGNPLFYTQGASSSDLGQIAPLLTIASFIPALAPFAQGLNAAIAAKQGNILGAVAGAAGLGGMSEVANAARFASALKSGDPLAIAMAGANAGGISDIGGVNLGDVSKGIGAVKAIKSGDPLAMLRYGMGALPKSDGLTSSIGPGDMDEFRENLIPGYFQPGGEGYIAPKETATGPGYYDEINNKFISDPLGGIQGPLGPETGNIDPNKEWEYSLTKPGVWTSKDGEEIDLSYMPDRDTALTGKELMEKAGAMPGGAKAPTVKAPVGGAKPATPGTKLPGAVGDVIAGAAGAAGAALPGTTIQQTSNADLLNLLGSKPELANIKSFKELFGEDLFGGKYVPPSAGGAQADAEPQAESSTASQNDDVEQLFRGGRVDDFDVDALLQILRS